MWPESYFTDGGLSFGYPGWTDWAVYQYLVNINPILFEEYGIIEYEPGGLAVNWTVSSNGLVYTFYLRRGVLFSNGKDPWNCYTAWLWFYLSYYMSGNSSTWYYGVSIFNMTPVVFGPATMEWLNSTVTDWNNPPPAALALFENSTWPIYCKDKYTLVFNLTSPFPPFIATLAFNPIDDAAYILRHGGPGTPTSPNYYFQLHPPPGTGPYYIAEVVMNQYMVFKKNPYYWGRNLTPAEIAANPLNAPGYFDTIIIKYVLEDSSRLLDLTSGKAQVAFIPWADLALFNSSKWVIQTWKWSAITVELDVNSHLWPLNCTDFRLAMYHAINVTQLIESAFYGYGEPMVGPEVPAYSNFSGYNFYDEGDYPPYQYNLTLALILLEKAAKECHFSVTLPNGTVINPGAPPLKPIEFQAFTGYGDWAVTGAQLVAADLEQIGIPIEIVTVTPDEWFTPYGNFQTNLQDINQIPPLTFNGPTVYAPDYLHPCDYWIAFVSNMSSWGNWDAWDNPRVDYDVLKACTTINITETWLYLKDAQKIVYEEGPYDWLVALTTQVGGSFVWPSYLTAIPDPTETGQTTVPIINTIYPTGLQPWPLIYR
jgi:ABC-type transport system substrate-binding protein